MKSLVGPVGIKIFIYNNILLNVFIIVIMVSTRKDEK